jgi:hypothetical protein
MKWMEIVQELNQMVVSGLLRGTRLSVTARPMIDP